MRRALAVWFASYRSSSSFSRTAGVQTLGIFVLLLASVIVAQRARRPGAASWLRWLGFGLAAAALGLALWRVAQMVGDHRRADAAPTPATSSERAPRQPAA